MRKVFLPLIACSAALLGTANAATLDFTGRSGSDRPTSVTDDTPCSPLDICGTALEYLGGRVVVSASSDAGDGQLVVQDLSPRNSGLGIFSEAGTGVYNASIRSSDEINSAAGERLVLTFENEVALTNFELNNGTDQDCPDIGPEGGCGLIDILVDNVSISGGAGFAAEAILTPAILTLISGTGALIGTTFEFVALDESFHLGSLDIVATPLPGAALFMGAGLVAFARRRKKA